MMQDQPDSEDTEDAAVVDTAFAQPVRQVTPAADADETVWVTEVDHLFHLKKEETAGSIDAFKDLLKDNADVSVYVNPEPIYTAQGSSVSSMIPANLKNLIAGNYYTGSVNFEKGKILLDGTSYVGKELAAIYKKYDSQDADLDMLEKYPSNNITGFLLYGLDFRIIGDIVKSTGLDGIANMGLHSSGLTLDDILNAFKGQMMWATSDFATSKQPNPYYPEGDSITKTDIKYVFALKVGEKAAFDKVMTSPMLQGMFTKQGDHYVMQQEMPGMPAVSITDKLIVAASDKAILDAYLAGKGKAEGLDNSFVSKIKGNPLGGYVNFEKIFNGLPYDEIPADGKVVAEQVKNLLKDATILTHKFDGKVSHSEAVLNFKNENENSLVQLVNLGTNVAKYYQEHKEHDLQTTDSAAVTDTVEYVH